MNPYDDNPPSRHARSSRPDGEGDYPGGRDEHSGGRDDRDYHGDYEREAWREDPTTRSGGRASVGRAQVGRASVPVPPPGPVGPVAHGDGGSHGGNGGGRSGRQPAAGRSSLSGSYGSDDDGFDPLGDHGSVPGRPPMGGRANMGRASVRPVSPTGGPGGEPIPGGGAGGGPGGPPRGPRYPWGRGPGGGGPRLPFGRGRRGADDDGKGGTPEQRRRKRARRRNIIIAAFAVFIMVSGVGVVGGTYYVDTVKFEQNELAFPETTQVYYSDGTLLAKLGQTTRYAVPLDNMTQTVQDAIVASEDKTFWTNDGVDFTGVIRAAWNNFTGGNTQGASTITQQYARVAFDLSGSTYSRKMREAVLAWKISDKLSKKQILEYYLNSVPFGRQTYGVEAAAQAFFAKTVKKDAPAAQQLTLAEAMLLVLMVKQPNPDPNDPKGSPGYDPTYSPEAAHNAQLRWDYVHQQLIDMGKLKATDKIDFPTADVKPYDPKVGNGLDKPAGLIMNHVFSELVNSPGPFKGKSWESIRDGGYKIYTTLNYKAQMDAEAQADETLKGSQMFGQPATLEAALVSVEPGTGRVLAYYGGHDGNGGDFAGVYKDEDGKWAGFGAHAPGSSFKVYTLAAALKAGISLNSYWQWTPHDMLGRTGPKQIRNASDCVSDIKPGTHTPNTGICSLFESTTQSLNTTFYGLTVSVSPKKVLEMARDAGIDHMWSQDGRVDFTSTTDMTKQTPSNFDTILGIGQYPITVADHANGLATFANNGVRATEHFVLKVLAGDQPVFGETLPTNGKQILNPGASADLTYALQNVGSAKVPALNGAGFDTAGKTGTWEANNSIDTNAHAWMCGFTKKIATCVWVGNKKDEKPIKDKSNATIWGSGIPSTIWRNYMAGATKDMALKADKSTKFAPKANIGDENPAGSVPSPTPAPPPTTDPAQNPGGPGNPGGQSPSPGGGQGVVFPLPIPITTRRGGPGG
jgi:membrane peptidoglycan carboxypeptidase